MALSKSESKALKQIRAAAKDAAERGDHAALAALPGQIDSLVANEASEELATALRNIRQVRAHYRAQHIAELVVKVKEMGETDGYNVACEDEGDQDRGAQYVIDNADEDPDSWANWAAEADFTGCLGVRKALVTSDVFDAYLDGLCAGYRRRAAELREAADEEVEPTLVGWSIGADGITVRGEIPDNDMEAWRRVFVLAAEAITGLDGTEAERAVDAVIKLAGQIEDDPRNDGGVRELFPWSINGLEEVEYDGDGTGINALDLRDAALEAWEWPSYYKFEGGEALWFENNGRCAVAFNGNAIWTDAGSIEEGIGRVILGRVIA